MKIKSKRILLAAVSAALIGVMGAAGTFAYLQDSTEDVVNTFETNSVRVSLTETELGENNTKEYSIIPGTSASKDPTVTVNATLDSYVFVEVTGNVTNNGKTLVEYEIAEGWKALTGYENVYYREVKAEENGEAGEQTFGVLKNDTVYYPASLTNEDMAEEISLSFKAIAIQQAGFADAEAAYQMKSAVYTSEAGEAKKALNGGNSVVLSEDIDFNDYAEISAYSSLYVNGKKAVTIDLNGRTITGRSNSKYFNTIKATGNGTVITINGEGNVIGGSATTSNSSPNNALEVTNKGKIIVNGGTYTVGPDKNGNGNSVVFSDGGDIVINGGFFYTNTAYNGIYWVLNKQDGSSGSITCYGGTFVNCDPSKTGTEPEGQSDNFVAEGYKVVSEEKDNGDIWYTVVPGEGE